MSTSESFAVSMMIGTLERGAHLAAHLGAGEPGQHEVEQHEVGAASRSNAVERRRAVGGDLDLVPLPLEQEC